MQQNKNTTRSQPVRVRRRWAVPLTVVFCAVVAIIGVQLLSDSSAAVEKELPWPSGLFLGTPAQVAEWENFRGTKVTAFHASAARGNGWGDIESAGWVMGYYKNTSGLLIISQPFWPENIGGSLAACASGSYDANWKRYGTMLQNSGRNDRTVTRLAWEFNGDWFQWKSSDPEQWKACWRKVVTAVRSTAPGASFEWAMNAHGSQTSGGDAWKSYPGDDVVDLVGIDAYDHYPASRTAAEFDKQCNDSEGLCNVAKFARTHGKKIGVGEWGVAGGGGGIGDNPLYIQKMYDVFFANRDIMGYETYFNEQKYGNALINPRQNPSSADKYVALFGANSPAIGVTPIPPTPTPPTPPGPTPNPPTPTPPTPTPKTGDLNGDGRVNLSDLSILLAAWNKTNRGDLNGDGRTNLADLSLLLSNWNK